MEKVIIIKYGELNTKKGNINFFLKMLRDNINNVLKDDDISVRYDKGRMFIFCNENFDEVVRKLQKVFGIHEINIAYKLADKSFDYLSESLKELIKDKDFKTFKVATKRSDKSYEFDSTEISRKLGGVVLKNKDSINVDVHNPEIIINVEIRNDFNYIYFEKQKGLGGFPVGSAGKGLLMLSGGIDSPVAGFFANKRGVKLEAIYFESPPHTSEQAKNKVESLASKLAEYNMDIKLHVINFTEIQESIYKNCPHEYLITIMRRMMYRISEIIANRNRCHILINGESIGQVASQTLTSMSVINEVVKMPVIRPLACFDKEEIVNISKSIDTYETSILPYEDCCTIFVPEHPVINPDKKLTREYEEMIDYKQMIYDAIKNHEVIRIEADVKKFEDIL